MIFDLSVLPIWYQYTLIALLGSIIGSFVNVIVYRMHTGVSIGGRSRCFSCGVQLRWFELLPGVSYIALLGSCRSCRAQIPRRDFIAEISLGIAYVLIFTLASSFFQIVIGMLLTTILLMVILYDITHLIIPNEFVISIASIGLAVLGWQWFQSGDLGAVAHSLAASLVAFISYGSLWKYSRGRWIGLGDAKLAAAVGLFLTPVQVFSMVVLSFWIGAAFGVMLLIAPRLQGWLMRLSAMVRPGVIVIQSARQNITMKSELPFAPFIIVAFGLVYVYNVMVLDIVSYGFGL